MTFRTLCDTGTLHGFKGAVNRWLLNSLSFVLKGVLQFLVEQVLVVFESNLSTALFFPTWACAAGFNNNNKTIQHYACTMHHGVKKIGRWTQFCDPLKKNNAMNSLEGISWHVSQYMCHNNSNNFEAAFVKLSEKNSYFITEFIDVWQQFAESYCFVTLTVKISKKSFRY